MVTAWITWHLADVYGPLLGKYTSPMDASWETPPASDFRRQRFCTNLRSVRPVTISSRSKSKKWNKEILDDIPHRIHRIHGIGILTPHRIHRIHGIGILTPHRIHRIHGIGNIDLHLVILFLVNVGKYTIHSSILWDCVRELKVTLLNAPNERSMVIELVVEPTPLKNISQIGSSPQVRVNIKNVWNHHLDYALQNSYQTWRRVW